MNKHMLHNNILTFLARLDRKLGKYSPLIPLANRWVEKMPRSSFGLRYYGFVVETRDWLGPFMTYKSAAADLSLSLDCANDIIYDQYQQIARLEAELESLRTHNDAEEWLD